VVYKGAINSKGHRQEAYDIFSKGVDDSNRDRAIELLISKAYDYQPKSVEAGSFPTWFYLLLLGGMIYCVLLSFRCNFAVELGSSAHRVKNWRVYNKGLAVTFPIFVFATFAWPKIEDLVRSLF